MKRVVITLVLIFGLMSCTQTKYFVKSESALSHVDWNYNLLNYIPLMDNDLKNSVVLDSTYNLLYLKKYSKLNKYLSSVQSNGPDIYLAKTLYHISKNEYQKAVYNLRMINGPDYMLVKELLFIDMSYELAKQYGSKEYNSFLQDYQALIDRYPENESLKKITALRTRYIRYNY